MDGNALRTSQCAGQRSSPIGHANCAGSGPRAGSSDCCDCERCQVQLPDGIVISVGYQGVRVIRIDSHGPRTAKTSIRAGTINPAAYCCPSQQTGRLWPKHDSLDDILRTVGDQRKGTIWTDRRRPDVPQGLGEREARHSPCAQIHLPQGANIVLSNDGKHGDGVGQADRDPAIPRHVPAGIP